jgi:hypothetical protein
MEKKFCLNCFKNKPVDEFSLISSARPNGGYKSKCKQCLTEIEARRFYEGLLEKNPENYWECDVCDHVVKIKNTKCTKCKQPKGSVDLSLPGRNSNP